MIMLSVFCRSCGQRIEEEVDEQVPPRSLCCSCGARYRLTMEDESGRNIEGSDAGIDDDVEVSAQELQSVEASPETEAPRE